MNLLHIKNKKAFIRLVVIAIVLLILISCVSYFILNKIYIYKDFDDFPNGVRTVIEGDTVRFYQDISPYVNILGERDEIYKTDYENGIVYYSLIFHLEITIYDEMFNKGTSGVKPIKLDGKLVGSESVIRIYNPKDGNYYKCDKRIAVVYYRNKDGSLILLWKADIDNEEN